MSGATLSEHLFEAMGVLDERFEEIDRPFENGGVSFGEMIAAALQILEEIDRESSAVGSVDDPGEYGVDIFHVIRRRKTPQIWEVFPSCGDRRPP